MRRKFEYFDSFQSYNFVDRNSYNKEEGKTIKYQGSKFIKKRHSITDGPNWFRENSQSACVSKQTKCFEAVGSKTMSLDRKMRKNWAKSMDSNQGLISYNKMRPQSKSQQTRLKKRVSLNGNHKSSISSLSDDKASSLKRNNVSLSKVNNPQSKQFTAKLKEPPEIICQPLHSQSEMRSMILYKARQITSFIHNCVTEQQSSPVQPLSYSQIKTITTLHRGSSPWQKKIQPKISQTRSLLRSLLSKATNSMPN